MSNCFVCEVIAGHEVRPGTHTITDALDYPETYNGKMLCDEHWKDREYQKTMDPDKYIRRIVNPDDILGEVLYNEAGRRIGVEGVTHVTTED